MRGTRGDHLVLVVRTCTCILRVVIALGLGSCVYHVVGADVPGGLECDDRSDLSLLLVSLYGALPRHFVLLALVCLCAILYA